MLPPGYFETNPTRIESVDHLGASLGHRDQMAWFDISGTWQFKEGTWW